MMTARILLAISLLAVTSSAQSAWDAGVGVEGFRWVEYPATTPGSPKESGPRSALFVDWTQDGERGGLFAWRTKLYGGTVNYDTYLTSTGAPVSTKTDYNGVATEGQAFYRYNLGSYRLEPLAGIGVDFWRRGIRGPGADQVENYAILFLRAGLRLSKAANQPGLHAECGIKYPAAAKENAFLESLGYTSNPSISPKGLVSGYAEVGYRIDERFDVLGYYDSWRFGRSADVRANKATDPAGLYWLISQPKSSMDALGIKLLYTF